jgi:3-hydroxyacyl-CoA dehydrogenase
MAKRSIEKVVVLGAGTMGARIAAHVANAGVWCALLDIAPAELTAEEQKRGPPLFSRAVLKTASSPAILRMT